MKLVASSTFGLLVTFGLLPLPLCQDKRSTKEENYSLFTFAQDYVNFKHLLFNWRMLISILGGTNKCLTFARLVCTIKLVTKWSGAFALLLLQRIWNSRSTIQMNYCLFAYLSRKLRKVCNNHEINIQNTCWIVQLHLF